jgi:hypothetical protein
VQASRSRGRLSTIAVNRVVTASITLNVTGSRGTDGTSVAVIGPTGPQGLRGATGLRGGNIYLLSSSWNDSACGEPVPVCYGAYTLNNVTGGTLCSRGTQGTYYTNYGPSNLLLVNNAAADGFILFTDSACTTVASNITAHNGFRVLYTDGAGAISSVECSVPPTEVCNGPYTLYPSSLIPEVGYDCQTTSGGVTYYTTYNSDPAFDTLTGGNSIQANGFVLYTDSGCDTEATNVVKHNGIGAVFTTNASGIITGFQCGT